MPSSDRDHDHEDNENFKSSLMGGLQSAYLLNKRVLNKVQYYLFNISVMLHMYVAS